MDNVASYVPEIFEKIRLRSNSGKVFKNFSETAQRCRKAPASSLLSLSQSRELENRNTLILFMSEPALMLKEQARSRFQTNSFNA